MLNIKVSTCAPDWPWSRQTPSGSLIWEDVIFHVDTDVKQCDAWVVFESLQNRQSVLCPADATLLVTGEPSSIGTYPAHFITQFAQVMTSREDLLHPEILHRQQGHPWFVEKSYDELLTMPPPVKQADICLITSDKVFTEGHRDRLQFAMDLKARLGVRLDLWGRGIRDFQSSWDVLSRYRYAIVLENLITHDWMTEKLPDALLAWCVPVYLGCTNLNKYLPQDSCIELKSLDPVAAVQIIEDLLRDPNDYERRRPSIQRARDTYLNHLQFFANLASVVRELCSRSQAPINTKTLYPVHCIQNALFVPEPVASPLRGAGIRRLAAAILRIPSWRMMEWADELNPFPPPPPPPSPPPPPPPPPPSLKQVAHASWIRANGDQTLRLDYAIDSNEIVLDVGGFEGQWASDIFSRYLCKLHVFEPVPHFAESIRRRFANNPNIYIHEAALGNRNDRLSISIDGDASSTLLTGEGAISVALWNCSEFIRNNGWNQIALMKMNIEGGEYELLEHLIETGLIEKIRHIQIQFHDFVPDAHQRMLSIQKKLQHTHELTYYFPFIWENWKRKGL